MKSKFSVMIAIALVSSLLLPCCNNPISTKESGNVLAAEIPAASNKATDFIASQLEQSKVRLYVYNEFADGRNYFTQKAFMGDNYLTENVPAMNEASSGAFSGKTCISATLDLNKESWGGYMFLNGVLRAGSIEPELDFGDNAEAKVDLTGAARLIFYAKGETGNEQVEFIVGGLGDNGKPYPDSAKKTTGYIKLNKEWTKYEINLLGMDLSAIGCGFAWVTNDMQNYQASSVKFYVDEIYYEFDNKPMFIKSYETREVDATDEWVINNFAYVYDNACALIALSKDGQYDKAKQIADALVYATEHDRYYTDGRLRNAYVNGDPMAYSAWHSLSGGEMTQNSGFWNQEASVWYEDYYAVSTSVGNTAWAIIALNEAQRSFPDGDKYLNAAKRLGDFILTTRSATGGFTGGYEDWDGQEFAVTYKSTEHNIDLITAFKQLAQLSGEEKYAEASEHARAFVLSMYDADLHLFYTGTAADGITVNKAVLPLDCNTWAILAMGNSFSDADAVLEQVENKFMIDGGYDFNTDKDGIWFEGTAQVALAYKEIGNKEKYGEILALLNANQNENGSITAADRDYVSTGFTVSGMGDMPWNYGKREHLGATAWLAFAQLCVNPLADVTETVQGTEVNENYHEFKPMGTVTVFMKNGTKYITYPDSFPMIKTLQDRYGEVKLPEESTRDFYMNEAVAVKFSRIEAGENNYFTEVYKITGKLSSGEEILKYTCAGPAPEFRVYTDAAVVSLQYSDIDRMEVDNRITPKFNMENMALITLRDGRVYKAPTESVQYASISTSMGIPMGESYEEGLPVIYADRIETVPFSKIKKVVFTPELINFATLKEGSFPCPGVITYLDGTERKADFAIGGYYIENLEFFCPGRYSFDLRNNESSIYVGPYINASTLSDVASIEFIK